MWSASFLEALVTAIFGLVLGSFATALIYREERGQRWFSLSGHSTRSACPACGVKLGLPDLVPLFSWLALRGKCRHCRANIPVIYPLTELAVLVLCVVAFGLRGERSLAEVTMMLGAVPFLWALCVIDLRHKILPDTLMLALAVLGAGRLGVLLYEGAGKVVMSADFSDYGQIVALDHLAAIPVYGGLSYLLSALMSKILKKPAMGMGDVKFFALAGLWLGLSKLADFMIWSGVLGVVLGIGWMAVRKENAFPFGPALIGAFYLLLLI